MKILIDTDWFTAIQDLPKAKQNEVLTAILFYPNKTSDTNLWNKTILPNLEKGKIKYFNKLQNLKQNQSANQQKTGKKITDSDTDSDTDSTIRKEYIYNNYNILPESNRDNKGGMGGKEEKEREPQKLVRGAFIPPTEEEFLKMAKDWNDTVGVGGFACSKQQAIDFWLTYDSQGWVKGNGQHITNVRTAFRRWLSRDEQDDKC